MNSDILALIRELARLIERHTGSGLLTREIIHTKNKLRVAMARAGIAID